MQCDPPEPDPAQHLDAFLSLAARLPVQPLRQGSAAVEAGGRRSAGGAYLEGCAPFGGTPRRSKIPGPWRCVEAQSRHELTRRQAPRKKPPKNPSKKKPACPMDSGLCFVWWLFTDSNRGPVDYDSIALTD
ncbi:unnamed protein product [Brugia timori]|uniref:Uncharacterized protein n=1 Tax=Brugia timori TaxID=42155 RepID=A0A0R3QJ42_9BILA|nr:unnamed protein product [Brugia timori]